MVTTIENGLQILDISLHKGLIAKFDKYLEWHTTKLPDFLENPSKKIKDPLRNAFAIAQLGEGDVAATLEIYLQKDVIDQLIKSILESPSWHLPLFESFREHVARKPCLFVVHAFQMLFSGRRGAFDSTPTVEFDCFPQGPTMAQFVRFVILFIHEYYKLIAVSLSMSHAVAFLVIILLE